jgi:branched-chain amino acid transport system permease protein
LGTEPLLAAGISPEGFIQQVISGIATGGIYASLALALVLIYRAMEAINFAQGEMATFTTFVAWTLITQVHISYWIVFPIVVAVAIGGGIVIERVIIRPVERAPILTVVLVTLGLFAVFNGLSGLIWGYSIKTFPSPFPVTPVLIGGVAIGIQDLGLIGVALVLLLLIYLFFSRTRVGLMMRSAALYPEASRLLGVRVGWMLALGWGLSAGVGAVSGMLVAPITVLDPNLMQAVLLYAFTAAVLGGIESPLGAVVGGLTVGVLLALVGTYVPGLSDLRIVLGLVVIVIVLLFRPGGLVGRAHVSRV